MFETFPLYVPLSLLAFILTLAGTRVLLTALRRRTPAPDIAVLTQKKKPPLPTGGGIAIIISLMVCLTVADFPFEILLATLLIAATSLMNRFIDLPLMLRSLVMVLAAMIPLSLMPSGIFGAWLPENPDKLLTGLLWIWFMATTAAIERTDGPFAIPMTATATGLCLIAIFAGNFPSSLSIHSLILASSLVGFLWWNWPPAKIRMGEVGAAPIGFLIGYLLMIAANSGYHYTAFILPAYVIAEGMITQLRRLAYKDPTIPYFYQQALAHGRSERRIAELIIGIHILLAFIALRCIIDETMAMPYVALAYFCVFMLLGFFAYRQHREKSDV